MKAYYDSYTFASGYQYHETPEKHGYCVRLFNPDRTLCYVDYPKTDTDLVRSRIAAKIRALSV